MGIHKGKWQGPLRAAEASGLSLAGYAVKHEINVRRLYEARRQRPRAKAATAFVRVKLKGQPTARATPQVDHAGAGAPFAMQARLGNGVVLNWTHDASRAQTLASLLHTLVGLPCSA